jgi:hypothetical protein
MSEETDWVVFADTPDVRTLHRMVVGADGVKRLTVRQEWKNPQAYLEQASMERSLKAGKSWGDGQVIGRVPLALYFSSGMAQARQNHDETWIKRFWNDSDNKYLRTKEGQL